MRTVESYLTLIAELEGDAKEISRLLVQNGRAWERIEHGAVDPLDWWFIRDRPAVRDVATILKFRHRFRNPYGEDLNPDKSTSVQQCVDRFFAIFPEFHDSFATSIREITDAI